MTFNEKKIIIITSYCHFLSHFFMLIFPSLVIPLTHYFKMPLSEVLSLGFFMYLFFGLGALPMGMLSDLWGSRKMLLIYLIGIGISSIFAGIAKEPKHLMVELTCAGIFASIYHPAGMGLISKGCRRRGFALGINGVFGNIGLGLAPIVTGILTYRYSWRAIYLSLGIIVLLSSISLFFVDFDETIQNIKKPEATAATSKSKSMLYFSILCVCMMFAGFCYRGTSVVIPTYFEQVVPFLDNIINSFSFIKLTGTKTLSATILTSIVYFIGIFGMMAGGRVADKLDLRLGYFLFHFLSLPFLILMTKFTNIPLFIFTIGYLFFALGMQPIENSLVAHLTPEKLRSTSYGVKFIFTFGIGSLSVFTAKSIIEHYAIVYVFWLQVIVIIALLITIAILASLTKNKEFRN